MDWQLASLKGLKECFQKVTSITLKYRMFNGLVSVKVQDQSLVEETNRADCYFVHNLMLVMASKFKFGLLMN